jgi:2-dehydropantoate 2-reductase
LFQAGQDVTLIARGEHLRALQDRGLTLAAPAETVTLAVPAVATPRRPSRSPATSWSWP